jgi:hypothetical protein
MPAAILYQAAARRKRIFLREHLSAPVLQGLTAAGNNGHAYMYTLRTIYVAQTALQHHGWFVPFADTGQFGTDYPYRALVAVFGLAANRPQEAVYTIGVTDQADQPLDGGHTYRIHFPAGQLPPARYFWSCWFASESTQASDRQMPKTIEIRPEQASGGRSNRQPVATDRKGLA